MALTVVVVIKGCALGCWIQNTKSDHAEQYRSRVFGSLPIFTLKSGLLAGTP